MKRTITSSLAIFAVTLGATNAFAVEFLLHNDTHHVIKSFTTQEKGKWSSNWIKGKGIKPGETWVMEFGRDGNCKVRVNVKSDDGYVHDYDVNFCKATEIFIEDETITYK